MASSAQPDAPPPLRTDAQHNRERLLAAARELFARHGIDVPLEEIARRAGVSIGTLYNRFPARAHLVEAVFTDRLEKIVALAREALADDDPWHGFAGYLAAVCELQAADRGFNQVAARGLHDSPAVQELYAQAQAAMAQVLKRAREAGELRADVALEDLGFVIWGISRTVEMTGDIAPQLWRRHLALMLDGFRAEGAHPLPEPPLAPGQTHGRREP
jgi:AcrR family transcriptional regulator